MEKMAETEAEVVATKSRSKINVQPRDASRKGQRNSQCAKEELINKFEGDVKKLKADLQLSRNKENDLRDQIVTYMTGKIDDF